MAIERGRFVIAANQKDSAEFDFTQSLGTTPELSGNPPGLSGTPTIEVLPIEGDETLTLSRVRLELAPADAPDGWRAKKVLFDIAAPAASSTRSDGGLDSKWELLCRVIVTPGNYVRTASMIVIGAA